MGISEHIGMASALAAAVMWGFLGIVVRDLSAAGFSPVQMTCIRYAIVAVVMAAFIFARHRRMFEIDRYDLLLFAFMGFVGNMLNSVCYFGAMDRISLSLSTVLQYISPFIVVALSVPLFREELTATKCVALVAAFVGCVLSTGLITDPGSMNPTGILLGVASGIFYSMYTLGSRKASSKGRHIPTVLLYTSIFCAIGLAPFADLPTAAGMLASSPRSLAMMLCLGVLMTLLPFGLYNYGISKLGAGKAAIVTFVEPLAATVVGFAFFGESLTVEAMVGMVLILASLMLVQKNTPRPEGGERWSFSGARTPWRRRRRPSSRSWRIRSSPAGPCRPSRKRGPSRPDPSERFRPASGASHQGRRRRPTGRP